MLVKKFGEKERLVKKTHKKSVFTKELKSLKSIDGVSGKGKIFFVAFLNGSLLIKIERNDEFCFYSTKWIN